VRRGLLLLAAVALAPACTPTCQQTCEKLLACEQNEDWLDGYVALCAENCERQLNLYELWDDTQLQDALDQSRVCIGEATCDDIADGVCYDEDLYSF
jgi:hypothetical protein